jgi:C-terminal processing protease CtpA/Prc
MYVRWRPAGSRRPPLEFRVLPGNIGYLALNTFQDVRVAEEFESRFVEIARSRALILDLRRNGGGSDGHGRRILNCLFNRPFATAARAERKNLAYERAHGKVHEWNVWPQQDLRPSGSRYYAGPIFVLAGPRTGSAAENFLISLDIMKRATIFGEPTSGSTGQPLMVQLPGGGTVGICTSKAWYPDGRDFVGVGIQPQVRISPTIEDVRTGRDRALVAAYQAAGGEKLDPATLAALR